MNITGKWQGTLVYGEGYDEESVGKTLDFEFDIVDTDGEITATGKDLSGHGFNPTPSYMSGFLDEGIISFIKRYKQGLTIDENGQEELLPEEENYEINYSGNYNVTTKEFEGDWEIVMYFKPEEDPDVIYSHMCVGTWKMSKAHSGQTPKPL